MKLKAILLLSFLMVRHSLFSQNSAYQFSHLDIKNGLSNNQVNCIYKDDYGFMWFGTSSGLNRYDGYDIKNFRHDPANNNSLADNFIIRIFGGPDHKIWVKFFRGFSVFDPATESFSNNMDQELLKYGVYAQDIKLIRKDQNGSFWFLTLDGDVYCYHPKTKSTLFYNQLFPACKHGIITDIVDGDHNCVWLINSAGVIEQLNYSSNKITRRLYNVAEPNNDENIDYRMLLANDDIWVWANGKPKGAYSYNIRSSTVKHFIKDGKPSGLNSNIIHNIIQADDGIIWVGTDHGGINLINNKNFEVKYILSNEGDQKALQGNSIGLYKDNEGIIWCGSDKQGISYYHKDVFQFAIVKHFSSDRLSLPFEDINAFAEDKNGNLWVGTNGGGLIYYNRATNEFNQFIHNAADDNSLTNDIVTCLHMDSNNSLWIGTYFGGLDCFKDGKFFHYRHDQKNSNTISDDRVYTITEGPQQKLWIGTFSGGVNVFDPDKRVFLHPYSAKAVDISYINIIYKDKKNNMWLGGYDGLYVITDKGIIKKYEHKTDEPNSLMDNGVNVITEDASGQIWLGTKGGLSILNTQTNSFTNIDHLNGVWSGSVMGILEDQYSKMWISTTTGIAAIKTVQNKAGIDLKINKYDESDGLQGREYNLNAALKTKDGKMVFGGGQGFNIFNPANINAINLKPHLHFTDFQLFNQSVAVGDTVNGSVVLSKSITQTRHLVLNHNQNVFTIEFADFDFFTPNKIRYQYVLEGFDKGWLTSPPGFRKATYTNLNPGNYLFKVRATNINNPAYEPIISLKITVLPPFWKSPLAYFIYILVAVVSLFYIRYRGIRKLKREFALKQLQLESDRKILQLREESKRLHELDLMKVKFFTNVSHELRTPLSLILAPIEKILSQIDNYDHKKQLQLIDRNAKRLLHLVNQLLDFRKIGSKELRLNKEDGDIIKVINEISCSFNDIAEKKNIRFEIDSAVATFEAKFDHDKIERILFNLLSNAFKFTPDNGSITVLVGLKKTGEDDGYIIEIKVIDTGIGISPDKFDNIFDRFFQEDVPAFLVNQGSGIGLSITKEFVKLHNGEIFVESELGEGSCFTVELQVQAVKNDQDFTQIHHPLLPVPQDVNEKHTVLLVDDDDDFRGYLKSSLSDHFRIIEARNGKEGWQKALALHPDLIVADVNMDELDGIALSNKIKRDDRTKHIPIILLTALTADEDQLRGLETGATDYIVKPFNFDVLLSKLKNVLIQQQLMRKTFKKQVEIRPSDVLTVSPDELFIQKALQIIEKNISNYNFSVEEFSSEMFMSRITLYKKTFAVTGNTPVELIRNIRLKRAAQLLDNGHLTVSQICYRVGFKNLKYFSKSFKLYHNISPSAYKANKKIVCEDEVLIDL